MYKMQASKFANLVSFFISMIHIKFQVISDTDIITFIHKQARGI